MNKNSLGKNFGKKIVAIAKKEKMSHYRFAAEVGVSYQCIYNYVTTDINSPSINNIIKVIEKFPQYTCYIFELNPKKINDQVFLKD